MLEPASLPAARRASRHRPAPPAARRYACEVLWHCAREGERADLWLVIAPSHRAAGEHVRARLAGLDRLRLRLWRPDEPPGERIELLWYM
ncbi:hypothetical protein [Plastoroseomonas arctica]|uniref:Uncharacterized protein n=1 Tax=Plastoroseomonas arctica TaxID=1509237 RepID=A0AAF1K4E6_9PROT|nr:hypothetical protein [Plastoroseomonas arctica]MBR0656061.1 hypothetical protein [Plastoroseomonas arctica]